MWSKKPKQIKPAKESHLWSVKVKRYTSKIKISFLFFINKLKKTLQNVGLDQLPHWRIEENIPESWKNIHWKSEENFPESWKNNPRISNDFRHSDLVRCYSKKGGKIEEFFIHKLFWNLAFQTTGKVYYQEPLQRMVHQEERKV